MSKRQKFSLSISNKGSKLETNQLDPFWDDDDFDNDDLDDVILRATQETNKQIGETSVMLPPDYQAFNPSYISSQVTSTHRPDFGKEVTNLKQKCLEKEGEISILRANLDKIKALHDQSFNQASEWKDKFNVANKQHINAKSEIAFRNLEIIHLKETIRDCQKEIAQKNETNLVEQSSKSVENSPIIYQTPNNFIITVNEQQYPLKNKDFTYVFDEKTNENIEKWPNCRSKNFHNTLTHDEKETFENFSETIKAISSHDFIKLENLYPEIIDLINTSESGFNSNEAEINISRIVWHCLLLLGDLNRLLKFVEENMSEQSFQRLEFLSCNQIPTDYLGDATICNKAGQCARLLFFLAEIVPICCYFRSYLFRNVALNLDGVLETGLPILGEKRLMEAILKVVTAVGLFRKAHICSELLQAVVKFQKSIYSSQEYQSNADLVNSLTKEVIFSRSHFPVIAELLSLLKTATLRLEFNRILCTNSNYEIQKGLIKFTKETCLFFVYRIQLKQFLMKVNDPNAFLRYSFEILVMVHNILSSDLEWLYFTSNNQCKCLAHLYKFTLFIISKNFEHFHKSTEIKEFRRFFLNGITILLLLKHNSDDMIQKFYVEFKGLTHQYESNFTKLELDNYKSDLDILNTEIVCDNSPEIDYSKFIKL